MKRFLQIVALTVAVLLGAQPVLAEPSCDHALGTDNCAAKTCCCHKMGAEMNLVIAHCNTVMLTADTQSGCNDGECGVTSVQVASPAKSITPGIVAFISVARFAFVSISEPKDLLLPNPEFPRPAKYILFQVFRI